MNVPRPIDLEFSSIPPPLSGRDGIMRLPFLEREHIYSQWASAVDMARLSEDSEQPPVTSCIILYTVRSIQHRKVSNLAETFAVLSTAMVKSGLLIADTTDVVHLLVPTLRRVSRKDQQGCDVTILPCDPSENYAEVLQQWLKPYVIADTSNITTVS